jgi:hypothetical protein
MLRSVLEYAAEVWGGGAWKEAEQIQDKVGRILLGLSKNTPGEVPRGELGWLSLRARREFKQLLYWGKVIKMDDARLVKKVYSKCKRQNENLQGSFCGSVRKILLGLNLGNPSSQLQFGGKTQSSGCRRCRRNPNFVSFAA